MTPLRASRRCGFWQSIVCKNIVLFVGILLVAIVPLAWRYYRDCRDDALQNLAAKLAFFAERGASWVDVTSLPALIQPEPQHTPAYQALVHTLQRMEHEFNHDCWPRRSG